MKKKKLYIFINGVNNNPNDIHQCTDEMHKICQEMRIASDKYEYKCTFMDRRFFQWKRIKQVKEMVLEYTSKGFEVHLVGHSNGAAIACGVAQNEDVTLGGIHLIAAACDASYEKNGINYAVTEDRVMSITVFCSSNDEALQKANWISFLRFVNLGYHQGSKCLGLVGPVDMNLLANQRTKIVRDDTMLHSSWVSGENTKKTLLTILGK